MEEVGETAVDLTHEEADEVYRSFGHDPERIGIRRAFASPGYFLEGKGYTGVVSLSSGRVIRVKTKVPVESMFYMLGQVEGTHRFFDREVRYEASPEFWEVIVGEFARRTAALIRLGLHQGYVEQEDESLAAVRGRLLVPLQLRRNFVHRERFACRYVEFTPDLSMNQALKLATFLAVHLPYRDPSIAHALRRNLQQFGGISLVQLSAAAVRSTRLDRLTERYRFPLLLAALVIAHVSLEDRAGAAQFAAYLVDMKNLFQQYVAIALRERLHNQGLRVVAQQERALDVESRLTYIPDVTIWRGRACMAVLDTKYKRYRKPGAAKGQPGEDDVRQILLYAALLDAQRAILVYPESAHDEFHLPVRPGLRDVEVRGLDLAGSPAELQAKTADFVDELASDLRQSIAVV